nr:MAG TPA: major capsid protein [Bacteriophage sp.]
MIDTHFITGSGQNLTLGGQFTTYKMTNGIELTVKRCALFDNMEMFRKLHPLTGKPLMSYTFLFVDLGQRDGQANIVKVCRKGREFVQWCTAGSVTPQGYANNINIVRSNSRDGYQVHFLGEEGIMLRNPLSCGILYCDADDSEMNNDGITSVGA